MPNQLGMYGQSPDVLPRIDNPACTCDHCHAETTYDDSIAIGDNRYCELCSVACDSCDTVIVRNDDNSAYGRQFLCPDCVQICADCYGRFSELSDSNTSGDLVCEDCSGSYFYCEGCDSTCHTDDYIIGGMCQSCHDEQESEERMGSNAGVMIHNYSYKPNCLQFNSVPGESPTMLFMGWEIEAEGRHRIADKGKSLHSAFAGKTDLYFKKDGSLRDGAEIVSHPGTFAYWMAYDFSGFNKLREEGWRSYDTATCGMHVHLSRKALSRRDIFRIMRFMRRNVADTLHISRRDGLGSVEHHTGLAAYASLKLGTNAAIVRTLRKGLWVTQEDRYKAVNLSNRETVEIRIFRGTLNLDGIRRNLAFCYALTKFVRETTSKKLGAKHFSAWLAGKGEVYLGSAVASELKRWIDKVYVPVDTGH